MGNQQPVNGSGLPPGGVPSGSAGDAQQQQQQQQGNRQQQLPPGAAPYGQQQQNQQQQQQFMPSAQFPGGGGGGAPPPPPPGGPPHQYMQQMQQQQQQQIQIQQQAQQQQQMQQDMPRSASDASMTIMDGDSTHQSVLQQQQQQQQMMMGQQPGASSGSVENWLDDDTVPTVFRWEHGGRQVYITGTFNDWSRQIPMHRSGNDFTYIHNLERKKHAFKFIVDDEWRFAPDQPTVADIEGRINNFVDVTDFKPYTGDREFEREKAAAEYGAAPLITTLTKAAGGTTTTTSSAVATTGDDAAAANEGETDETQGGAGGSLGKPDKDGEVFSHTMPDLDDYTKEPPPLPPHLRHIILNKPPQLQDTAALPVPQHVALNHLYCTAIKDNMMVLGITQRYKTKFVTTVYYSPCTSK